MQHTESNTKVYQTTEYGRFAMILGNRELDETKINRIKGDISSGINVLQLCPIIVEEKDNRLHIIDGQHRFYVSKQVKSPVYYVISSNLSLEGIAKINSNTDKWKIKDFINCYVQLDNENYKILRDMLDKYKLPFGIIHNLLAFGDIEGELRMGKKKTSPADKLRFERGKFEVNHYKTTLEFIEKIMLFKEFKSWKQKSFIAAIDRLIKADKCDLDLLVRKFKDDPKKLDNHGSVKEYQQNLEAIYNYKMKERVTIF